MNNEEATRNRLKDLLYMKVYRELVAYEEKIRLLGIEHAMSSAYQIAAKRDILLMLENTSFNTEQYSVMLEFDNTLDELYREWLDYDTDLMENLLCCTENLIKKSMTNL